jgi:hypothetical protein
MGRTSPNMIKFNYQRWLASVHATAAATSSALGTGPGASLRSIRTEPPPPSSTAHRSGPTSDPTALPHAFFIPGATVTPRHVPLWCATLQKSFLCVARGLQTLDLHVVAQIQGQFLRIRKPGEGRAKDGKNFKVSSEEQHDGVAAKFD